MGIQANKTSSSSPWLSAGHFKAVPILQFFVRSSFVPFYYIIVPHHFFFGFGASGRCI